MKKGLLIIRKNGNNYQAYIKRADNKEMLFANGKDAEELKQYNNSECSYMSQKGKLISVQIDNKILFPLKKQPTIHSRDKKMQKQIGKNIFGTKKRFLRVPKDTSNLLKPSTIDNFYLKLNKTVHFINISQDGLNPLSFDDKPMLFQNTFKDKNDSKREKYFEVEHEFSQNFISEIVNKNLKSAENLIGKENLSAKNLKPHWRLIVGLGGESVYETSMTLHHIYGIPYIPASAIKGVVRSYIINEYFRKNTEEPAEYWALRDKDFCKIFGTAKETKLKNEKGQEFKVQSPLLKDGKPADHIGSIIFFDAFPVEEPQIEPDVMNVHYPDYYNEKEPPTDYQNPNPVFFLTVKGKFKFVIGTKKGRFDDYKIGGKSILQWLNEALKNHGIGAKTA
ncbi:MAG: type III-B CRISPR module RAMP protein Cmr6, partial [Bacteroidales bacterium]|nr:type III-B CRISPR module RAMP protein Cmr6 [Bacteroidales bacterium]